MAVLKDMESLTPEKVAELASIIQAKKDADTGKDTEGEPVNVVHIALMQVQYCSFGESLFLLPAVSPPHVIGHLVQSSMK